MAPVAVRHFARPQYVKSYDGLNYLWNAETVNIFSFHHSILEFFFQHSFAFHPVFQESGTLEALTLVCRISAVVTPCDESTYSLVDRSENWTTD